MKMTKWMCLLSAGSLFLGATVAADKEKAAPADKAAMMQKMEELGRPGPEHKALDVLVGDWNVQGRCWMEPGGTPTEQKGTASVKWILNGRFLQEDFNSEFMGKPFKGISVTGYDNMKKKYVGTWIDDMATGIFVTEGTASDGGKVFTFEGKMNDPMTGEKDKPMKYVVRVIDQNKHVAEMHDLSRGANSKAMEMTYTRRGAERAAK
jgi:hypothetical protein